MNILNIAAYRFVAIEDAAQLRTAFRAGAEALELKGTILVAEEGVNLFLAGAAAKAEAFVQMLLADARFAPIEIKRSWSEAQPFKRLLVKVKREIVAMRRPEIKPGEAPAPRLAPRELKRWLDEKREIVLLDTRNQFEVELGSFENALALGLKSFSHFPLATRALPEALTRRPVVAFCTGGIRCEKAAPWLISQGFREVYRLDGGILNYFEQCGGAHFRGECFVFDRRLALDAGLRESGGAPGCAKPPLRA